jgi:histidinol-phosphate aminotransferase
MNTFDINKLIRNSVRQLSPYQSARRIGGQGEVWLNANEFPYPKTYHWQQNNLHRYPKAQSEQLINAYANYANIKPDQLIVTRGADEAIDLLIKAFCEPNQDSIIYCPPTYGMYEICAKTYGVNSKAIATLANWQLDLSTIEQQLDSVKLVFVCRPNNPTGNTVDAMTIKSLLEITKQKALVVIDEAYIEFTPTQTLTTWLSHYPHLVILRTLSKAFALAGLRCGFAIANSSIIDVLTKISAPYALPTPVIDIAIEALLPAGIKIMRQQVKQINELKQQFADQLNELSCVQQVYPSNSNYLLVRFNAKSAIFKQLWQQGIILRDQHHQLGLENCIRITVGTGDECAAVIQALSRIDKE